VKDSLSFCALFEKENWPVQLGGQNYTLPSPPSFPPQLSLVIKNVDLRIDHDEFTEDLKIIYPEIHNVIRLKNKFQSNIKLIKIELPSVSKREDILNRGKIHVNGMTYDVDEYLSPFTVLICSKCQGIGHFRRQCTQQNETCKTCGLDYPDLRQHHCTNVTKCVRCNGVDHSSNSAKCPIVKSYRAALTKKILSSSSANANNNKYTFDSSDFPSLPQAQAAFHPISAPIMNKMDELLNSISVIKQTIEKIAIKTDKFEQFMIEQTKNDEAMKNDITTLRNKDEKMYAQMVHHESSITNHHLLLTKLILPCLDEMTKYLSHSNMKTKEGTGTIDADFNVIINRIRVQLDKARQGKEFC